MPTSYNFTDDGIVYSFDDIFVPADLFRSNSSGTLWAWGLNTSSQLGVNDTTSPRSTPVTTFTGGTNWKQISGGGAHAAAIKNDGTLWVWGSALYGRLGNGITTGTITTPITTFTGGTNWKQVSCGTYHISAIKTDGTLWSWGIGSLLGTGDFLDRSTPVTTIVGGTDWKQVSSGQTSAAAIKTDGTLWTWGSDLPAKGTLGYNFRSTPVTTFAGGTNWADTATGAPEELYTISVCAQSSNYTGSYGFGLKTDGTLWCWGYNTAAGSYTLGIGGIAGPSTPVTTFAGGTNWKQISATGQTVSAIKTDGTLWIWGGGDRGILGNGSAGTSRSTPLTTFSGGTTWKQVSAGYVSCMAIKTDGTLWGWGANTYGTLGNSLNTLTVSTPITTFSGGTNWKSVCSGTEQTFAIKTDGTLWGWGRNSNFLLATGDDLNRSTPVTTFSGGTNWKQVSVDSGFNGGFFVSAVKTDGTLWTWGRGEYGQLGNASSLVITSTPVTTFIGGTDWKQVSNNSTICTAVKTDGTLWTWGLNTYGQLGNANISDINLVISTPITTFVGGIDWKQVKCAQNFTLAIKGTSPNLQLYFFGNNEGYQGGFSTDIPTPSTTFAGGNDWKQVSGGGLRATKIDGTLWLWGNNSKGQLGIGDFDNRYTPVTTFLGGNDWKQTTDEGYFNNPTTSAIKTDGTLWVWGDNTYGQLGINAKPFANREYTPTTTFSGGTNWKQINIGDFVSSGIKTDGTLWVWGNNYGYYYGLGIASFDTDIRYTPVTTFAGGTDWKSVSSSRGITGGLISAIKTDGTLWIWGNGAFGALGNAKTTAFYPGNITPVTTFSGGTNWKQVSVGGFTCSAIKTDGTLWVWGNNQDGQLGVNDGTSRSTPITTFAGGTDWKQVRTGYRTLAVKTDGTLWVWGNNSQGQLGNASTASAVLTPITTFSGGTNWKQVSNNSVNNAAVAAIKTDGTLWLWGNSYSGQLGNGLTSISAVSTPITTFIGGTDWAQVNVGQLVVGAIKTDGTLWVWGDNTYGQLASNDVISRSTPITTFAGGTNWANTATGAAEELYTLSLYQGFAAIKTDGTLWVWGNNGNGQLGKYYNNSGIIPSTTFAGGTNWKQSSTSQYNISAVKTDGTLWVWGNNSQGQLGNTFLIEALTPITTFLGGTNWKQTSFPSQGMMAITYIDSVL